MICNLCEHEYTSLYCKCTNEIMMQDDITSEDLEIYHTCIINPVTISDNLWGKLLKVSNKQNDTNE